MADDIKKTSPLTAGELSEALDCFWNAALGAQQSDQSPVACIVEGVHAVSVRLEEIEQKKRQAT